MCYSFPRVAELNGTNSVFTIMLSIANDATNVTLPSYTLTGTYLFTVSVSDAHFVNFKF